MDCSDALLADLQTTQALNGDVTVDDHVNHVDDDIDEATMYYQHEQRQTFSDSRGRSSPAPPPLPPLPPRELLDTVHASTVS